MNFVLGRWPPQPMFVRRDGEYNYFEFPRCFFVIDLICHTLGGVAYAQPPVGMQQVTKIHFNSVFYLNSPMMFVCVCSRSYSKHNKHHKFRHQFHSFLLFQLIKR